MTQGTSCIAIINKQKCNFFFQKWRTGEQNRSYLGFGTREKGGMWVKGQEGWILCKYCVHMYVNGKTRTTETIVGMGEGG
jgi:hypothetical protein